MSGSNFAEKPRLSPVKGRFAPSPSGRMHLGNVATYLVAWLSAKSRGGSVVLRIEDLDRGRCRREYAEQAARDYETLGLFYDEGGLEPEYLQSGRDEYYSEVLERLRSRAEIYECFCTRAELHAASAPHASDGTPLYDRRCRTLDASERDELRKTRAPALRIAVPDRTIEFNDRRLGRIAQNLERECGDFLLRRSDGVFSYQLAVVADDIAMGVTEVVRGSDLASSAPRQIFLAELLGAAPPEYMHTPMLVAPDGRRLSKREKSLDLGRLLEVASPQQIVGTLAHLLGLVDRPEPLTPTELLAVYDENRLSATDIVVDESRFYTFFSR